MYLTLYILYRDYRRRMYVRVCMYEVLKVLAEGRIASACLRGETSLLTLLVDVVDSAAQWARFVTLVIDVSRVFVPTIEIRYFVLTVGKLAYELSVEIV